MDIYSENAIRSANSSLAQFEIELADIKTSGDLSTESTLAAKSIISKARAAVESTRAALISAEPGMLSAEPSLAAQEAAVASLQSLLIGAEQTPLTTTYHQQLVSSVLATVEPMTGMLNESIISAERSPIFNQFEPSTKSDFQVAFDKTKAIAGKYIPMITEVDKPRN